MEGSGPPPADERQIKSLPTVKISQEDVGKNSKNSSKCAIFLKFLEISNSK